MVNHFRKIGMTKQFIYDFTEEMMRLLDINQARATAKQWLDAANKLSKGIVKG